MKRVIFGVVLAAGGVASVLCITAARRPDTIRPHTKVGSVEVGGLTVEDAQRALRVWWEGEKTAKLKVSLPSAKKPLGELKPGELGVTLDDIASVKDLPMSAADQPPTTDQEDIHPPVFRLNGLSLMALEKSVRASVGPDHPAKVRFESGQVVHVPGVAGVSLDVGALPASVGKAVLGDHSLELPLTKVAGSASDVALNEITDVVAEFSTRFPTYKRTRCSNIKLAAHIIDGTIVLPGEKFSFNGVVGRRTLKAGFKVAGVYINGQHDTGVGGGICQVSTTLYNAALLSDLAIHRRSNHSLPVPYVPLGRDATVDYGNLDLIFENTYPTPIAVTSEYHPGKLTFRILGKKTKGLSVKIVRGPQSWEPEEVQHITDASLPAGQKRVIKPGSAFRSVSTVRVVYIDGKVVKREPLGRSHYGGQPRIVAVAPPVVAPPPPAVGTTPMPPANPVTHG